MSAGPGVGDPAPDQPMLEPGGGAVPLSSTWRERPAILVFLRYFGCPFCQMHVVALRANRRRFEQAGGAVFLIGQGTEEDGRAFLNRLDLPFPCLLDPDRRAYRAFGLATATPLQILAPSAGPAFVRANLNARTRQRGLAGGSFWQLPGTFVVDAGGTIRFAHRNRTVADSPKNEALLEVLASIRSQSGPS